MACPVACNWHRRAEQQIRANDAARLKADLDVYAVLARRAWAGCRCKLWERIQLAVKGAYAAR